MLQPAHTGRGRIHGHRVVPDARAIASQSVRKIANPAQREAGIAPISGTPGRVQVATAPSFIRVIAAAWFAIAFISTVVMAQTPPPGNAGNRIDVQAYGAIGDGTTDDTQAIKDACAAIVQQQGGVLYFPHGTYRFGSSDRQSDALFFDGISNLTILFEPGAVLLMDNLTPDHRTDGSGHAIRIRGPASNIWIVNATVRWKEQPINRGNGDGIRIEGFPDDAQTVSNIRLINCTVERSPQTGAVIMGCDLVTVDNFRVIDNMADGLHFNACRRVRVNGVTGINNGDDTLAFVTYYHPTEVVIPGAPHGPFQQTGLGLWNNTDSVATNIIAERGHANGVRLAGAMNVSLSNVQVRLKGASLVIDAGMEEAGKYGWSYLVSRGIQVANLRAIECDEGIFIRNFNMPLTEQNADFWKFDVQVQNFYAIDSAIDNVHIRDCAGVSLNHVTSHNSRMRLANVRDSSLADVHQINGAIYIVGPGEAADGLSNLQPLNLRIDSLSIENGWLELQRTSAIEADTISVSNAAAHGLFITNSTDCHIQNLSVRNANRDNESNAYALAISTCKRIAVDRLVVNQDQNPLLAAMIGGGHETAVSDEIFISNALFRTTATSVSRSPAILLQEGQYRPRKLLIKLLQLVNGNATEHTINTLSDTE